MSKKRYVFLIVSLVFCAMTSLFVCSVLCFGGKAFAAEHEKYNTGEEVQVKCDGSEFVFDNSGCATSGAENGAAAQEDKTGDNDKPAKLYVLNFKRGIYTYLNFKGGIDSEKYNVIKIEWSKNVNSRTTLNFYKNGDDPVADAPTDSYESGEGKYVDMVDTETGAKTEPRTTFFVNLYLPDFADEETLVNGIVIKHQTDERESDYPEFQIRVYSITLSYEEFDDYSLEPDGKDFTVSACEGYGQSRIGVSLETCKIYCNEFMDGKGVSFDFAESVNSSVYKTLVLKISLFINGFTFDEYYLNIYRGNDVLSVPIGGYVVRSTNDKSVETGLEIDIPTALLKSAGKSVTSFSVTNNGSKGGLDSSALSLFIWGIDVSKRESQSVMVFPVSLEKTAVENKDGAMKIIFGFETDIYTAETEISVSDCDVYGLVHANGKVLSVSDVETITVGYNNDYKAVAVAVKSDVIKNDGTDVVKFAAGEFGIKNGGISNKYVISTSGVFRLPEPVGADETVILSKESYVKMVAQTVNGDKTKVSVSFSEKIGNIDGDAVSTGIKLNSTSLYDLSPAAVVFSDENVLTLEIDSACFGAETNTLSFNSNLKVGNIFLANGLTATRYEGDALWYIESDAAMKILWFEESDITDEFLTFTIKISENFDGVADISSSMFMQKISINGKSFYNISEEGGLTAVLEGRFINFTIKRANITLNANENDLITVEAGFTLPSGYKTAITKIFRYSELWQNYEIVPDISSVKDQIQNTSIVGIQTSSDTTAGRLSLHIEFSLPISYRYYAGLQKEVCLLSSEFNGVASSNPSESYLSDLALYGILDSCVKKIKFDGKTVEQLLKEYKIPGEQWNSYIIVSYLGANLSNSYARRVALTFKFDDELTTLKKSHTIEFEKGFITPLLQTLNTTYIFKWDNEYEKWTAYSENSENGETASGGGCSSVIMHGDIAATVGFSLCVFAAVFIKRKSKSKEQCKKYEK